MTNRDLQARPPVIELDAETQRLLTASVAIPSLAVLVQELVYNSIDQAATCVAVRVHLDRFSRLQVVDNGRGVKNLKELCSTPPNNKRKISRSLYGTRRGCLHHIIKLCEKVTVTSRRHNTTYKKVFTSYSAAEFSAEKHSRPSCGTTVCVDNIFSQMPVRCVSMSYMDLDHTKDMLMKVAVANPQVAITLKDTKSGTILFQSDSSKTCAYNFIQYCKGTIEFEDLKEVRYQVGDYKLDALFSIYLNTKPRQMVLVNRRPVEDKRIKTFASDILLSALSDKCNSENKYPVFLINLSCKPEYLDICYESNNFLEFENWDVVFNLIYNSIYSFLEDEDINLPALDEDEPYRPTPRIPLKTMLASVSPNCNVKSDKAQRPRKAEPLKNAESCSDESNTNVPKEVSVRTPKRTPIKFIPMKRMSPIIYVTSPRKKTKCSMFESPKKAPSTVKPQSCFKTPSPNQNKKLINSLQNAPVLNHLIEAKIMLDGNENVINKENCILNSGKQSISKALADISSKYSGNYKRRSSTPLCPEKVRLPKLNLSPIQFSKTYNTAVKTKKRKRVSSKSKKKQKNAKLDTFPPQLTTEFHIETPQHVLDQHKLTCQHPNLESLRNIQNKENFAPKRSDSGYDTKNFTKEKDNEEDIVNSDKQTIHPKKRSSNAYYFTDNIENSKSSILDMQPFDIFQDHSTDTAGYAPGTRVVESTIVIDADDNAHVDETASDLEPVRFEIFQDDIVLDESSEQLEHVRFEVFQDEIVQDKSSEKIARFEVYKDIENKSKAKTKDCASSPIKIPVDRGCSPIKFTQLTKSDLSEANIAVSNIPAISSEQNYDFSPEPVCFDEYDETSSKHLEPVRFEVYHDSPSPKSTQSCEAPKSTQSAQVLKAAVKQSQSSVFFDDLDGIDLDKIEQELVIAEQEQVVTEQDMISINQVSKDSNVLSTQDLEISLSCFDCSTQQIKRRLDFVSQKQSLFDPILGEVCKPNILKSVPGNPKFEVAVPVNAARHIIADCSHWNKEKSKVVLLKPTSFDLRKWKNPIFDTHGEGFLDAASNAPYNMKLMLDAHKFNKSVFDGLRVLGQIDNKFIGCVTKDNLLVLVDQHAAHERVRLECMLKTLHVDSEVTNPVVSHTLPHSIPVKVPKHHVELIKSFIPKLKYTGFGVDLSKYHCNLMEIPKVCFTESGELNMGVDVVVDVFTQLLDQIRSSEGSDLSVPQKLVDYLHSKSCHGAIRFGDELTHEQCNILIDQLSYCDLPFQCAHGRPSFAPIINLCQQTKNSSDDNKELNFMKLRSRFQ